MLYSWARNDVTRRRPSIDLVLKLFCERGDEQLCAREAFHRDGPLFRHQLLRASDNQHEREASFLARSFAIDERIAAFLIEEPGLDGLSIDPRLAAFTSLSSPSRALASLRLPESLLAQLQRAVGLPESIVLFLSGPEGAGKRSAVEALCSAAHRSLLTVDLRQSAAAQIPTATLIPLLQREAALCGANLFSRARML